MRCFLNRGRIIADSLGRLLRPSFLGVTDWKLRGSVGMSQEFIQKITAGIQGEAYRVELNDHVVVFCHDGFRCEGELMGYCPEGVVIECNGSFVWLNADWIGGVVKVRPSGGSGGGSEAFAPPPPAPAGKKSKAADRGNGAMQKVFCNGTR